MNDRPDELEALKKENAELRELLAHSRLGSELYRKAAYDMFRGLEIEPLTDEEIAEAMNAPRGESLRDVLAEIQNLPRE